MPAKSASLPRFSSCESTATAPHCASASTIFTPGMIGLPGKWPAQSSSVTVLRATTRSPGTSSITSSIRSIGSRCGRIASIAALSEDDVASCRQPLPQAVAAAVGVALGRSDRQPGRRRDLVERRRRTRPCSDDDLSPAPRAARRGSGRARGASPTRRARGPDRRRAATRASSKSGSVRRVAAQRACATSLQVLTTSRCSQVENCDSPLNWPTRCDELHERLLRGVARVLGVAQDVERDPLDPRGVALAERRQRQLVSVLRAPHQNRVREPLVDERPVGPQVTDDSTASGCWRGCTAPTLVRDGA